MAIATMAKMPVHQRQQHQCNEGKNAIVMMARMPAINDDENANATGAMTPAWGWQWCHCNKGNNVIMDQESQSHCYKGNNSSLTTTRMPVHPQWQWYHCHEGNNPNHNNGKDACTLMAMALSQRGQQRQLNNKRWGQWC
jgi:hypothetical protein